MSERAPKNRRLHAVPDADADAGQGPASDPPAHGDRRGSNREPEPRPFHLPVGDPTSTGDAPTAAELIRELEGLGLPRNIADQARSLGGDADALREWVRVARRTLTGDPVAALLAPWTRLLARRVTALDAELAAAEILRTYQGLGLGDDFVVNLTRLVEQAEHVGRPEALVMCRMVAHLGPHELRSVATRAANTLAGSGVRDRPWVGKLGTAAFRRSYGIADPDSAERLHVLEFAYGPKVHAFVVLTCAECGGVAGMSVTDETAGLFAELRIDAMAHGHSLETATEQDAAGIVRSALAIGLCVDEDEPDVDQDEIPTVLPVLLERLATLAQPAAPQPVPARTRERGTRGRGRIATVHRIKVTLAGTRPPIWRRLEVPSDITLLALHEILLEAFEWTDDHLWVFEVDSQAYGVGDLGVPHRNAAKVRLGKIAPYVDLTFTYFHFHDFGDNWRHRIKIEQIAPAEPGVIYPWCLGGRRAAPTREVAGGEPDRFHVDVLNGLLVALAGRGRR